MQIKPFRTAAATGLIAIAGLVTAAPYAWINWDAPNTPTGTITTDDGVVGVTLTGSFNAILETYPSWNPDSTWADGTIVDNAPDNTSLVQTINPTTYTLTFDRVVTNLAFCVWSVGQSGNAITYTFDHNLVFVDGGPSAEFSGQAITTTANSLTGEEGNGTVLFAGPLTTLAFSTNPAENFHGFNFGLNRSQPVPEPATLAMLGLGSIALLRRRKR